VTQAHAIAPLVPDDPANRALLERVHPPDWANPVPAARYHLVVLGAGTAGLITAAVAAGVGARVALVESHRMGGDCLNVGCVPSKALIRASRVAAELRDAAELGWRVGGASPDFARAMARMRRVRAEIARDDSAARYARELGVDVFFGHGRFAGAGVVEVGDAKLRFRRAVIATGARATVPPIPGLVEAGCLTNETVFDLEALPRRIAVIGAGPIGCELAQALARFGAEVVLLEVMPRILIREDPDAAELVARALARDGVRLVLDAKIAGVAGGPGAKRLELERAGARETLDVDEILIGAGRAPNVAGLGLEQVGVEFDAKLGVKVDARLRTTSRAIYAAGDVCMAYKFTHAADAAAKLVVRNALFPFGRGRVADLVMPWCTYTDPEIAHVGLYESEARERGLDLETFTVPLERANRAVLDGESEGFARVHVRRGSDRILGATVVARHAGEMISELTLAMVAGVGLGRLASVIHPYPTQAEAIKATANAYLRTRLTPLVRRVLGLWLRATG
jgi:pyruvate/2-oxoglutarate dehydrogenase complex dihydrolipoamide dehydrogenase (E3) component